MTFIKTFKGFSIWYGTQFNYTGYLISIPGHEALKDLIRSGNTMHEAYQTINRLLTV